MLFIALKQLQFSGADGELAASLRYLSQRFSIPDEVTKGLTPSYSLNSKSASIIAVKLCISRMG
ncbi:MAG: hypothetical protein E7408_07125 [Ruminococcaceae bacterium]|nr:hypothetical protein [Oscillospiraceae bacterium]